MAAKFFGQFLIERERITREQLLAAVELWQSMNVKIGTLAIIRGYMTEDEIERVKQIMRTVDKRFGEIAVDEGFLTQTQVDKLLKQQQKGRVLLGEALVQKGFLTEEVLSEELEVFEETQEKTPNTIEEVYSGKPNAPILVVFADMVTKMFIRIANEIVKIDYCHHDASAARPYDFTISQPYDGTFQGKFCLSLTSDILVRIARKMYYAEAFVVDEIARDAVAEFVSLIGGNVCAKLREMGMPSEIFPPEVHDNRNGPGFDLPNEAEGAELAITPVLHPESGIEFWVIDRTTSRA